MFHAVGQEAFTLQAKLPVASAVISAVVKWTINLTAVFSGRGKGESGGDVFDFKLFIKLIIQNSTT